MKPPDFAALCLLARNPQVQVTGIELDDHIRNVVAALQPISADLGLPG